MHDRPVIYAGLLIFLGLFLFPAWRDAAGRVTSQAPVLAVPAQAKQCVAPVQYMREAHMKLLLDWRDQAVRQGQRRFVAADGRTYTIALTPTCLEQCHGKKAEFCDRCHNYAAVAPDCWNCHLDTNQPVLRSAR
jgi:hypothetical protein